MYKYSCHVSNFSEQPTKSIYSKQFIYSGAIISSFKYSNLIYSCRSPPINQEKYIKLKKKETNKKPWIPKLLIAIKCFLQIHFSQQYKM